MQSEKLSSLIFYSIEKAIKTYRQHAQRALKDAGLEITVDQWLTLKGIADSPGITHGELSQLVFKDVSSIAKILDLLETPGHIIRRTDPSGKKDILIEITKDGKFLLEKTQKVVDKYRAKALKDIPAQHLRIADSVLKSIIINCKPEQRKVEEQG